MAKLPSSYVLVKNRHGQLIGIFTDFDIRKKFQALRKEKNLQRPISAVMKRPLHMLTLSNAHMAGEYMIKHSLRHVPIVEKSGVERKLVGVITMKQLFKDMVRSGVFGHSFETGAAFHKTFRVGLLSPDGSSFFKFQKFFKKLPKFAVDRLWMTKMRTEKEMDQAAQFYDLVLFDIDSVEKKNWLPVIEYFNHNADLLSFGIIFTPMLHPKNLVNLLKKLRVSGRFYIYAKPLDLSDLLLDIEETRFLV